MVAHPVADHKILANYFGKRRPAFQRAVERLLDTVLNFCMNGHTDQIEYIVFGGDVLIHGADR